MNDCEKTAELISCLVDEELEADKRAELEAHIAECPECAAMYQDFMSIRGQLRAAAEDVPEHLHKKLMSQVRKTPLKKKKPLLRILRPYVTAAACLVVIISAVFAMNVGMGKSADTNSTGAAPMEMYGLKDEACRDSMPAVEDQDYTEAEGYDSNSDGACISDEYGSAVCSSESPRDLSLYILQQLISDQADSLTAEAFLGEYDVPSDFQAYFDCAAGLRSYPAELDVFCACPDASRFEDALSALYELSAACMEKGYKEENMLIMLLDDEYLIFALGPREQLTRLQAQAENLFRCSILSALS